jgi:AraC-like DNA-binding protein
MQTGQLQIFHQFEAAPIEVHWHEFYELSLIMAGEGSHVFNGEHYELKPGSIFLLTPADFHGLFQLPGVVFEIYNVIFSEELLEEELRHLLFDNNRSYLTTFTGPLFDKVVESYRRIDSELSRQQPGHRLVVRGELTTLLVELARQGVTIMPVPERGGVSDFSHPAIRKAITLIQHHFREDISLPEIAGLVRLNPNYFSERFKAFTGSSFQRYLINLRLEFAASLLRVSQVPVTEICYASGFKTLSHFERVFKLKFHQTPYAYRRNLFPADLEEGRQLAAI